MSFMTGLFDGSKGSGFQAQGTDIQQPTGSYQAQLAQQQAQSGILQQQDLLNALAGQNGIGNQSSVFNQLQGVANGTGPNPAQAQLAQATGANTANQAALMAGQRGVGANPALIARQAAMQGAANQQNAAGQAATMQANQSLNALGQLGGIAGQQVAQQQGALNSLNQNIQGNQGQVLNAIQGQNNANVGMQSNMNNANAQIAGVNAKAQNDMASNIIGGASKALMMASGGSVPPKSSGPQSIFGQSLMMAQGGKVPAMVSPGEVYLSPDKVKQVAKGKDPIKAGERIPGKAKVAGNSYANDTVKRNLDAGGVVIPKSVMESKDPHAQAEKFVLAVMAKHGMKKS